MRQYRLSLILVLFALMATSILSDAAYCEAKHKLYLPHPFLGSSGMSSLTAYDFDARRVISRIEILPGAMFARVTPDGENVWVFSSREQAAEILDVITDESLGKVYFGAPVSDAVFSPDGSFCYVANGSYDGDGQNSVTFVNVEARTADYTIATGANPVSIAIQKDGSRIYVANKDDNSITVIDPINYAVAGTLYAGLQPHTITLSNAGRYLFVTCMGIDRGEYGGSGVNVIDTETGKVVLAVGTGKAATSLGLSGDGTRMAVCHVGRTHVENLWLYDLTYEDNRINASLVDQMTFGRNAEFATVGPAGKYLLIPDHNDGSVFIVDMFQPGAVSKLDGLEMESAYHAEFAAVDFEKEIALRDQIIAADASSLEAQAAFFEKAYLQNTAGDRNAVVTTYSDIAARYPGTPSETKALFALGDLCYDGQLLANSADYYNRGLISYGRNLSANPEFKAVPSSHLLLSAQRLSELSAQIDDDYFVDLYKTFANIPAKSPDLPQLIFTFGVALDKNGNSKYAKKCYEETENRIIELMDENVYREMKCKLSLVRESENAILKVKKISHEIILDGRIDEWSKSEELPLYRKDNVIVNQLRWLDKTDISGSFYALYDQYNLYLAASVMDDKILRSEVSRGDYLTFYIDTRTGAGDYLTRERNMDEDVIAITVLPPEDAEGQFRVRSDSDVAPIVGGTLTASGYSFELKVPLAYLRGFNPEKRKTIGLGIELFDADSETESDPPKIMGWLMPTKTLFGPRFSELFGILEF